MQKIKVFDVVILNNGNKAIINNIESSQYFGIIFNKNGEKLENRRILEEEIIDIEFTK